MEKTQKSATSEEIKPRVIDEDGPYDQAASALLGLILFALIAFLPWFFFGSIIGVWIVATPFALAFVVLVGVLIAAIVFGWTGGKVSKPPGFVAHRFLSRVLTKRVYRSQFGELIDQARDDHATALSERDAWQAKVVLIDLNIRIAARVIAAVATLPIKMVATVLKIPFIK
ncbi:hypothetical protein A4U53_031145 [Rhizobium ruizarguesonis]|uniref:Uncharacterized protein n=2 Tax=Rhizobium TaxID=379 RepID=A0A179BUU5_RHILE|nr:hypothetical protein [Rhizobium leguminosarum]OAP95155.1 hypothetical protein A4U53_18205 [Rhizobium leguminosarum]